MATLTMSSSHAGPDAFSHSMRHTSHSTTAPHSATADTLPSIDFGFDNLRRDMSQFRLQFDDFIERGRRRVLAERSQFQAKIADIQKSQLIARREIDAIKSECTLHRQQRQEESEEVASIRDAIEHLEIQRQTHESRRDEFKAHVITLQKQLDERRKSMQKHQRRLDEQEQQNEPELRFWEDLLGLKMEATGIDDRLRFVFEVPGVKARGQECWVELDMSSEKYDVVVTSPALDPEDIADALDDLNRTGQLVPFLKQARQLLMSAI